MLIVEICESVNHNIFICEFIHQKWKYCGIIIGEIPSILHNQFQNLCFIKKINNVVFQSYVSSGEL